MAVLDGGPPLPALGMEEQQLHAYLVSLAGSVRDMIPHLAQPAAPGSTAHLLERDLQTKLAQLRSNIRDFELLGEEQDNPEKARSVEAALKQHRQEYENLRKAISDARLEAKEAVERTFSQQRAELLSGAALPALLRKPGSESEMVRTAQDITHSLRRTQQALAQQLEHAAGNLAVLDTGNATLSATKTELSGQTGLLREGHKGLNTLKRQSTGDRWLLWCGLLVFLLTAGYVGYKRAPPVVKAPIDLAVGMAGQMVLQGSRATYHGVSWAVRSAVQAAGKQHGGGLDDRLPAWDPTASQPPLTPASPADVAHDIGDSVSVPVPLPPAGDLGDWTHGGDVGAGFGIDYGIDRANISRDATDAAHPSDPQPSPTHSNSATPPEDTAPVPEPRTPHQHGKPSRDPATAHTEYDDEGYEDPLDKYFWAQEALNRRTFAERVGLPDTPEHRSQYPWMFLYNAGDLATWMMEHVDAAWAEDWIPTSGLPREVADLAWEAATHMRSMEAAQQEQGHTGEAAEEHDAAGAGQHPDDTPAATHAPLPAMTWAPAGVIAREDAHVPHTPHIALAPEPREAPGVDAAASGVREATGAGVQDGDGFPVGGDASEVHVRSDGSGSDSARSDVPPVSGPAATAEPEQGTAGDTVSSGADAAGVEVAGGDAASSAGEQDGGLVTSGEGAAPLAAEIEAELPQDEGQEQEQGEVHQATADAAAVHPDDADDDSQSTASPGEDGEAEQAHAADPDQAAPDTQTGEDHESEEAAGGEAVGDTPGDDLLADTLTSAEEKQDRTPGGVGAVHHTSLVADASSHDADPADSLLEGGQEQAGEHGGELGESYGSIHDGTDGGAEGQDEVQDPVASEAEDGAEEGFALDSWLEADVAASLEGQDDQEGADLAGQATAPETVVSSSTAEADDLSARTATDDSPVEDIPLENDPSYLPPVSPRSTGGGSMFAEAVPMPATPSDLYPANEYDDEGYEDPLDKYFWAQEALNRRTFAERVGLPDTSDHRSQYPWMFLYNAGDLATWMMEHVDAAWADVWFPKSGLPKDVIELSWEAATHMRQMDAERNNKPLYTGAGLPHPPTFTWKPSSGQQEDTSSGPGDVSADSAGSDGHDEL